MDIDGLSEVSTGEHPFNEQAKTMNKNLSPDFSGAKPSDLKETYFRNPKWKNLHNLPGKPTNRKNHRGNLDPSRSVSVQAL